MVTANSISTPGTVRPTDPRWQAIDARCSTRSSGRTRRRTESGGSTYRSGSPSATRGLTRPSTRSVSPRGIRSSQRSSRTTTAFRTSTAKSTRSSDRFADETAVLVAVEPGASSVGTVGDLLALQELLEADWDWSVTERLLVSDVDSDHVTHVCRELSIRAVHVA